MKALSTAIGVVVGLAFVFSGLLVLLGSITPTYQAWNKMDTWQSIPAELKTVSYSSEGVKASYRFSIASIDYYNNRIFINQSEGERGEYQQQWYTQLQHLKDNNEKVDVWYNPSNPDQSIIYRDISWSRLFFLGCLSLFLVACGFFIIYKVITTQKVKKIASSESIDKLKKQWRENLQEEGYQVSFVDFCDQQNPESRTNRLKSSFDDKDRPWLIRKEWRSDTMGAGSKKSLYLLWIFSVIWTLLSFRILFEIEDEIYKGNYAVLIAALFPIIGLYLINKAWQKTRLWKRYGDVELEMDPFPGVIGGDVGGKLLVNNIEDSHLEYRVQLECVFHFSKNIKPRERREKIRWSESTKPSKLVISSGARLKFNIAIPIDLPESNVRRIGKKYHTWRLRVFNSFESRDDSCNNLIGEYDIPVFFKDKTT